MIFHHMTIHRLFNSVAALGVVAAAAMAGPAGAQPIDIRPAAAPAGSAYTLQAQPVEAQGAQPQATQVQYAQPRYSRTRSEQTRSRRTWRGDRGFDRDTADRDTAGRDQRAAYRPGQPTARDFSEPRQNFSAETPKHKSNYKGAKLVRFEGQFEPGSIVVRTAFKKLYFVLGDGQAIEYGIGVGREGFQWSGITTISDKKEWPSWHPPEEMRQRQPELPEMMPGGPKNPLGARAVYLGDTLYRIHGTSQPWTIGTEVSSGCIRLLNEEVIDLYNRVAVGAKVYVL